jgi:hypothetical protein
MFFGIADVFSAWENLSGSVLAIAGAKAKSNSAVDHSYITPTIIGSSTSGLQHFTPVPNFKNNGSFGRV